MKRFASIVVVCYLLLLIGCQEEPVADIAEATAVSVETATEMPCLPIPLLRQMHPRRRPCPQ